MAYPVAFVICTERGSLEQKSNLLVRSLRRFGGALKDAPVYSFAPRQGRDVSPATKRWFRNHGVIHTAPVLNTRFLEHGVNNKPFVARHAEETLDHEVLVIIDSDQIVVDEPSLLRLPPEYDAAASPVAVKGCGPSDPDDPDREYWTRIYAGDLNNIGAGGPDDPEYEYWAGLHEMCGIADPGYVETTVDRQRILTYWNSGLVAVRRERGLLARWHDIFVAAMERGLRPRSGSFYVEQSTLAAAFGAAGARIRVLPDSYNYHFNLQHAVRRESERIDRLDGLVTIHYHSLFDRAGTDNPLAALAADRRTRAELDGMLRRAGVWPSRQPGWARQCLGPLRGFRRRLLDRLRPSPAS